MQKTALRRSARSKTSDNLSHDKFFGYFLSLFLSVPTKTLAKTTLTTSAINRGLFLFIQDLAFKLGQVKGFHFFYYLTKVVCREYVINTILTCELLNVYFSLTQLCRRLFKFAFTFRYFSSLLIMDITKHSV